MAAVGIVLVSPSCFLEWGRGHEADNLEELRRKQMHACTNAGIWQATCARTAPITGPRLQASPGNAPKERERERERDVCGGLLPPLQNKGALVVKGAVCTN